MCSECGLVYAGPDEGVTIAPEEIETDPTGEIEAFHGHPISHGACEQHHWLTQRSEGA